MTTRLLAPALALALLAPGLAAAAPATSPPPHPDDYAAAALRWVEAARADLAPYDDRNWTGDVERALDRAEAYARDGRVRSASDDVVWARTVLAFHAFWDELSGVAGPTAKRARTTQQMDAWHAESGRAIQEHRDRLAALEGSLTSLVALEAAIYAADWAAEAHYDRAFYDTFRREIQTENFDAGLVLGLVAVTKGAEWRARLGTDLLDRAEAREGLAPRYRVDKLANLTVAARLGANAEFSPPHVKPYDELVRSTAATEEDIMAVAAFMGSIRATRIGGVQTMFGDAAGRGLPAENDLGQNINASLEKDILPLYTEVGLEGLVAMGGIDQALHVRERGERDISSLAKAWIAVEHAATMAGILGELSPIARPEAQVSGTEEAAGRGALVGVALVVGAAALAVGLVAVGRRYR